MNGPHHLAKFDITVDNNFIVDEEVYRRCPHGNRFPPYSVTDMFMDIKWDEDLLKGLSVNRSKFANPTDALWSPISEDKGKKKCQYQEKKGVVFRSKVNLYPASDLRTGAVFHLVHSPINCNVSHCDILVNSLPDNIDKRKKREVKAFLATLFFEV